jgi:pimeloyl-ACP methyl ester carboxylesterase
MTTPSGTNDIAELRQFIGVHAANQNIEPAVLDRVLAGIGNDLEGDPASWAVQWTREAQEAGARGELTVAGAMAALARFPFVDGPARAAAARVGIDAFTQWAASGPLQDLRVESGQGTLRLWTAGLSTSDPRPLVVLLGGIVATKEQYAPVLLQLDQLGLAGAVAELAGVGENTWRYDRDSWQLFPAILDALADRAQVDRTHVVALSFSGHLALRAAARDDRIRGVVTAGAPIREFFESLREDGGAAIPRVTRDTLAHLLGCGPGELAERTDGWELSDEELSAPAIPVRYIVSSRDEIVPPAEAEVLRAQVKDLELLTHDDVHGSPAHVAASRTWCVLSVLRLLGGYDPVVAQLEKAL